ncbi:hypothetical protein H257_19140 [Aphanomyces astaci]|uniref:Crinkler effector protein N-terminal domain-containing protein n=1 Tax=Aphanomyces astaci TaxID=112090 RepID=W4F8W5_APHAT|nr:hypothetical protein H257_19140 [Aphanomyces astaci]ETV63925.1 hypothetical protein H257_19140 [Aphanomyces astaci]|eukprot:XP_009846590.1 hypothetical protein H257_19140 [Aphanomyces astaci]
MAKDGAGFSCEAAPAVTLDELQDVQRFKAMRPALSIKKAFGGTFPSNEEEVYVFAVAPKWRLFCVVVGGIGPPFPVTIREDETVGELKEKIAIKTMYQFPAYSLELVMAKDGAGFSCEAAPAVTLDELQDVQRFKAMRPALSMKKAFGGTFPSNEEEVYVFAVAPKYAVPAPNRQLFCVVVGGTGPPFPVTIREDETVGELKERIAIKTMYQFPAYSVELVMAKDGAGFYCEAAPAVTLGELQDVQRFKAMGPALSIKKAFGGTIPSNEGEVYVFAVAPDQPAASTAASLVEYKKHKRNEDESSMSISRLSLPKIAQLGYSTKGWTLPPVDGVPRCKDYVAYMLQDFVPLMVSTTVRFGLSTPVGESRRRLTGAPDLYVLPSVCADTCGRTEVVMVIELKKHDTLSDANIAQTVGYLIAAHTLFDKQAYRPTPVGVLTNLRDEWHLFWVDPNGEVCMMTRDSNLQKLTRETAWQYIRKHCEYVSSVLQQELAAGAPVLDDLQALKLFPVFGDTNTMAGQAKKFAPLEYEDNMADVLETEEEVLLYQMSKRLQRTTAFDMPYAAMYS